MHQIISENSNLRKVDWSDLVALSEAAGEIEDDRSAFVQGIVFELQRFDDTWAIIIAPSAPYSLSPDKHDPDSFIVVSDDEEGIKQEFLYQLAEALEVNLAY